jgi:predicted ATPase
MKIKIQNLGVVKNAEIDLSKDLIVLCGKNNTGKTYVAYSIYGLFSLVKRKNIDIKSDKNLENLFNEGSFELDLHDFFLDKKNIIINKLESEYKKYLPIVFASNKEFFKESLISLNVDNDNMLKQFFEKEISRKIQFGENIKVHFSKEHNDNILKIILIRENNEDFFPKDIILKVITDNIYFIIFSLIFNDVYIAPAERIAINIFSKELSEKRHRMIDAILDFNKNKNPIDYVEDEASRYSLPIRESLRISERLDVLQKRKSFLSSHSEEIEKEILKGKVKVSKEGNVQFSLLDSKLNIDIHLSASIVKSLASIVLYCKHLAKPNDFIIIDEPELNLHPDNQRKIARIIAQLVNVGIKVMISTHSDYIIRELNNLIMLNVSDNVKSINKLSKKYGYKKEQFLDYKKVGAYLFTDEVKELEITNLGFEVQTIDEQINELNNSAREIFLELHDN